MLYFAGVLIFLSVFLILYVTLTTVYKRRISIENRIEMIVELDKIKQNNNSEKQSFVERALLPIYKAFSKFFLRLTTSQKLSVLNKRLDRAGMLKNNTTEKWLFAKNMLVIIFSLLMGLLTYMIEPNLLKALLITFLIILIINVLFNIYISSRIETRKKNILKSLSYTIDLITVSVEAGLSFDGAMARVVNNISGEISDEFAKGLKEIKMGIQRKIALKNMSDRCDIKELSMFITSIIQSDDLGVSLGKVLRIESSNLRESRKQAAREKAMKAPIKMLFPLILFIFPAIYIIILGPAVIKIMNSFMKG